MSKGKEHKKYEFGAKALLVVGKNNGVILGAYSLPKNDYDGHWIGANAGFFALVSAIQNWARECRALRMPVPARGFFRAD